MASESNSFFISNKSEVLKVVGGNVDSKMPLSLSSDSAISPINETSFWTSIFGERRVIKVVDFKIVASIIFPAGKYVHGVSNNDGNTCWVVANSDIYKVNSTGIIETYANVIGQEGENGYGIDIVKINNAVVATFSFNTSLFKVVGNGSLQVSVNVGRGTSMVAGSEDGSTFLLVMTDSVRRLGVDGTILASYSIPKVKAVSAINNYSFWASTGTQIHKVVESKIVQTYGLACTGRLGTILKMLPEQSLVKPFVWIGGI